MKKIKLDNWAFITFVRKEKISIMTAVEGL